MTNETQALIAYRLQRAHESLDEASLLLERDHINTFVNRVGIGFLIIGILSLFGLFIGSQKLSNTNARNIVTSRRSSSMKSIGCRF